MRSLRCSSSWASFQICHLSELLPRLGVAAYQKRGFCSCELHGVSEKLPASAPGASAGTRYDFRELLRYQAGSRMAPGAMCSGKPKEEVICLRGRRCCLAVDPGEAFWTLHAPLGGVTDTSDGVGVDMPGVSLS